MYKKLFVLFIVLVLVISLSYLYVYNKNELDKNSKDKLIIENNERIIMEYENIEAVDENMIQEIIYEEEMIQDLIEEVDVLGTLIIEKISLVGKVKKGTSDEILEEYIGHIENTALYDGNIGLAAHNRGNKYSYFARLNELNIGDKIIYKTKYGQRTYIVNNKIEILDTDWSPLENTQENKLTLITCINNKVNQRLCVQAVQTNM